ncbi:MAG: hypothetical protein U5K76_04820 [Woeseiaceae bacterium]|nr:hypothetical protein [Woeseiaceae bacterium]
MNALKSAVALLGLVLLASSPRLPATPATGSTGLTPHAAEYEIQHQRAERYSCRRVLQRRWRLHGALDHRTPTGLASVLMSGSIVEQSEFETLAEGIRPQHYQSVDTLSKDDKTMSFRFDWQDNVVVGAINKEDFRFSSTGPFTTRVSIQYELMHNLLNGEESGQYALLDGDELKELTV